MSELECEHGRLRRQCNECELEQENQQLQATNQELLSALRAVMDFGNDRNSKRGAWAMEKADKAITNAKQMGDKG